MLGKHSQAIGPSGGAILSLHNEQVFILCNPYELNGVVESHPSDVEGFASMNCYLLAEPDRALLVDSGLTVHRQAILAQLDSLLAERELRLLPLRIGDFAGLCNMQPIAERLAVAGLYGTMLGEPHEWLEFQPNLEVSAGEERGLAAVPGLPLPFGGSLPLSSDGQRRLEILVAPIRLLPMPWAFDSATGTLFTFDVFGWVTRPDSGGPWILTEDDEDSTTLDDVWHYLVANRYWWLAGARTERLLEDLREVLDSRDVVTIAPGYGCVLHGAEVVRRHVALLEEALTKAATAPSVGIEVGRATRRAA